MIRNKSFNFIFQNTVVLFVKQIVRVVACLWPRDRNMVALGAWMGKTYGDSPKYLAEYLLENSDLQLVWIGDESVRSRLPENARLAFRKKGSLSAAFSLLRAGTWVCCISIEWDLTTWPLEGFAKLVNTVHGYSLKKGGEEAGRNRKASFFGGLARKLSMHRKPWGLVGSEKDVRKLLMYDSDYFAPDKMMRIGSPTVSWLINNRDNGILIEKLRAEFADLIGFNPKSKIVAYLPTWRANGGRPFSFYSLDVDRQQKWKEMLERNNAVLVEKLHPRSLESYPVVGDSICSFPVSAEKQRQMDVHELMLVTDVLVSDYSSVGPDFGVLERPCINFMYDLDSYIRECGLIDGWEDMLPGPMVKTEEELFNAIDANLRSPHYEPAPGYKKTCEYQTGHTCEQILSFIKGNEIK